MNIVIADDSEMIRNRVKKILRSLDHVTIVGEASDGEETVETVLRTLPDLLIVDIHMPKKNGIEVTAELKRQLPNLKVFVLTNYFDAQFVEESKKSGADHVFDKSNEFEMLPKFVDVSHGMVRRSP